MPNHQKTDEVLEVWSSLREKIGNLKLTIEDVLAHETLNEVILFYEIKEDKVVLVGEMKLWKELIELVPTNHLLVDYQKTVLCLLEIIIKVKYGMEPSMDFFPKGGSGSGIIEVD